MTYIAVPLELQRFIHRNLMKKQKWSILFKYRKEKKQNAKQQSYFQVQSFPSEIYFAQTIQRKGTQYHQTSFTKNGAYSLREYHTTEKKII